MESNSTEPKALSWRNNACLWALYPGAAGIWSIASAPEGFAADDNPEPYEVEDIPLCDPVAALRLPRSRGNIAVVPIAGPIGQSRRVDWAGVYTEDLERHIVSAANNDSIGAIVLDINSPGGIVYGTPELAATVYQARQAKPIYAVATGMAASAAYWIGSQATKIFAAPSSEVGSIGVWSGHIDMSKCLETRGFRITLVHAGEYKIEGHPYAPLDDEARDQMQRQVDSYYSDFLADVARGRGTTAENVRANFGQGRLVRTAPARKAGMIDGEATLAEVVSTISERTKAKQPAYRSLERMGFAVPVPAGTIEEEDDAGQAADN